MAMPSFHPAVAAWFDAAFAQPTPAQREAWPAIAAGRNVLIAAPTGSGKTLAAFLAAIDALVRQGVAGTLADETSVVYVSPLKALSNDVRLNLEVPLAGIRGQLERMQLPDIEIRTAVRTGDTPQAERAAMRKRPPHIVVTTPESLYILLGSDSGRRMLATTRTVIVDEIHALAGNKRGSHLALTLERLDALCGRRCTRIGLSATQKPIEEVARFLVGSSPLLQAASSLGGEAARSAERAALVRGPEPRAAETPAATGTVTPLPNATRSALVKGLESRISEAPVANDAPAPSPQPSPPTMELSGERELSDRALTGVCSSPSPFGEKPRGVGELARFPPSPPWGEGRGEGGACMPPVANTPSFSAPCTIIDTGHQRRRDLAIELTAVPLQPVMSNDAWGLVYDRLAELIGQHRTTLVFANTRRTVERATRHLAERLGKDAVAAHHGSLSKEKRLDAERRLKSGHLRALVATASLELGIDIGEVDLVCQLSSPRSIAAFLQRAGRAGHAVDGISKARLLPTSRDDLVECVALLDAVRRGELDVLRVPAAPLDVLAQQIVAEVACGERGEDELFALFRAAYPYRNLARGTFTEVVRMLAEGYSTRRGIRAAYVHRDAVNGRLRARRGARMTALTSGGAIPDTADYEVVMQPESLRIGSVHEDFAVESIAGDIFQLGNQSYRILRIERGRMQVEDAKGAPPSIPFWFGEAPGRSDELSCAVSRLREETGKHLAFPSPSGRRWREAPDEGPGPRGLQSEGSQPEPSRTSESSSRLGTSSPLTPALSPSKSVGGEGAKALLMQEVGISETAARQLVDYLATARTELGVLPTQSTLVMERFFDESGGMQLVIHSPYGSRLNRAWGLALRKRFCRSFNFELQAAATEDAIVLSLSTSHSFPLAEVARYLHSNSVTSVLTQALLDAPMFALRFRWNAGAALALPRFSGGRKVPPQIQRMKSEDLLATVFPDQVACLENIVGERKIPDHPLVAQTLDDCLHDAMDVDGLIALLKRMERGEVRVVARDLTAPSALAAEVLGARPYAFLDGAPLEERRTQAVAARGFTDPQSADDLGRLDPAAIAAVREEAWPTPRDADETHEALLALGAICADDLAREPAWQAWLDELAAARRATTLRLDLPLRQPTPPAGGEGWGEGAAVRFAKSQDDLIAAPSGDAKRLPSSEAHAPSAVLCARRGGPPLPNDEGSAANPARAAAPPAGEGLWVAAESLPMWRAVHSDVAPQSSIEAPAEFAARTWTRDEALVEIIRTRLACVGPTRVDALAATFGFADSDVATALAMLEREGVAMRGRFTADATDEEWCDRALLARIHRRTLARLRREIEPVAPRDFMRFLLDWQHVAPATRLRGPDALVAVLEQLEGFEAPAAAWESQILPGRVAGYDIAWLDALCGAGRVTWMRLRESAEGTRAGPVRSSPIVLLLRRHLATWNATAAPAGDEPPALSSRAQAVVELLAARGASFFGEIADGTRLLKVELEDALGELVAAGVVGSDSFAGLRALLLPSARRNGARHRRLARHMLNGVEDAGRWSLVRRDSLSPHRGEGAHSASAEHLEHVARVLLRRWGVVFWKLLQREAAWLPPWRELRRVYQRLEARGEIRGGRFVEGVTGEQFALAEAVEVLRRVRKRAGDGALVVVSGADPLNLVGGVIPGTKVAAIAASRIAYRDGVPAATRIAGEVSIVGSMPPAEERAVRAALAGRSEMPAIHGSVPTNAVDPLQKM